MQLTISVVVPYYNAERYLRVCLPSLRNALDAGEILQLLLVDDCSRDTSSICARSYGFEPLMLSVRQGAGEARNLGAAQAKGDILLFLDADVLIKDGMFNHVVRYFQNNPEVSAVFGSYDHLPMAKGSISQFRNLLHHYTHQRSPGRVSTFWSGCGAVRRADFEQVGGFDARISSLEDVEIGLRLTKLGKIIQLDPQLQVKHLKRWTLSSMIYTDIILRALPWTRLARSQDLSVLNFSAAEKLRALVAILAWSSLLVLPVNLVVPACCWLVAFASNFRFYRFLFKINGARGALSGFILHQFYYLYSSITYVIANTLRL